MALASFRAPFDQRPSPCPQVMAPSSRGTVIVADKLARLPLLTCRRATLRDLRPADAPALLRLMNTEEVTRFISPPPTSVEGFERFVTWAHAQRATGHYMCFAVVPHGGETAGIIQVRQLEEGFGTAEWGFVVGPAFWGSGLFVEAAELVLAFAFDSVGVHRLEARTAVANGRGNGALRKLGARREAILRESFCRGGRRLDQILWSILDEDWRRAKASRGPGADS